MEAPAHGVAVVDDLADELVEEGLDAAMGGDDGKSAAPLSDGFGNAIKQALILVEGEFVEFDMAALASEGVRIGGKAVDAAAIDELKDVGGTVVSLVEDDFAKVAGDEVEDFCPILA